MARYSRTIRPTSDVYTCSNPYTLYCDLPSFSCVGEIHRQIHLAGKRRVCFANWRNYLWLSDCLLEPRWLSLECVVRAGSSESCRIWERERSKLFFSKLTTSDKCRKHCTILAEPSCHIALMRAKPTRKSIVVGPSK